MTSSKQQIAQARRHIQILEFPFSDVGSSEIKVDTNSRLHNWPVVYIINNDERLYVGETTNFLSRTRQHLQNKQKQELEEIRVILDGTFNKSTCLDLESQLIMLFSGDGKYEVINSNAGVADCDYFDREHYQVSFDQIVENLRVLGLFNQSALDIRNSNLFKYSPYKALNEDQLQVTEAIMDDLWRSLEKDEPSVHIIQGSAGTGKTIVGIFLTKLLSDLGTPNQVPTSESVFDDYYLDGYKQLFEGRKIGLVVPQQSLRASVKDVFSKISSLDRSMVLTPFDVGESDKRFDILIVDEAHRLNRYSAQANGAMTNRYRKVNERLFGNPESGTASWTGCENNVITLYCCSIQNRACGRRISHLKRSTDTSIQATLPNDSMHYIHSCESKATLQNTETSLISCYQLRHRVPSRYRQLKDTTFAFSMILRK